MTKDFYQDALALLKEPEDQHFLLVCAWTGEDRKGVAMRIESLEQLEWFREIVAKEFYECEKFLRSRL